MTEESAKSGVEGSTGRRTFLKTVGAAGTVGLLSGQATAGGVDRVIGDGLSTSTGRLQEAMIVFTDVDSVGRMAEVDLARGYYAYESLPMAYAELTGEQIREIADWESVMRVVEDRELELYNDDSQDDTNAREVWERDDLGYTGESVHAAVIDTGVSGMHPAHDENVESIYQWAGDPRDEEGDNVVWADIAPGSNDENGHGTHVVGSLAGDGDGAVDGDFSGMAPDTTVTAYQAVPGTLSIGAAAYDHIITGNREGDHDIRLVSNSWGWDAEYDPWGVVPQAVWGAFKEGIVSLFAAGNAGPSLATIQETKDPFVLSVGATDAEGTIAEFSSRGIAGGHHDRQTALTNVTELYEDELEVDEIDGPVGLERPGIAAKGANVMSALSPEQNASTAGPTYVAGALPVEPSSGSQTTEPLYGTISGTSMACPTVSGCVVLFLDAYYEAHGEWPNPIDTINTMEATAREAADDSYRRTNVGSGYVDAKAAVEAALEAAEEDLPPGLEDGLPPGLRDELPPGLSDADGSLPGFDDVELADPLSYGAPDGEATDARTAETVVLDTLESGSPAMGSPAVGGGGLLLTRFTDSFALEEGAFAFDDFDERRVLAELTWNPSDTGPNSLNLFLQQRGDHGGWEDVGFAAGDPGFSSENSVVLEVRDGELYDGEDGNGNPVRLVARIEGGREYRFGIQSDSGVGDFEIKADFQVYSVE